MCVCVSVSVSVRVCVHLLLHFNKTALNNKSRGHHFTLRVVPMQDSKSDGAMHLVLTGDDDRIEESSLSRRVQGIGQGHSRTQLLDLYHYTNLPHTCSNESCVVSVENQKHTNNITLHTQMHTCTHAHTESDLWLTTE